MVESLLWDVVLLVLLAGLGWYYMRLQKRLKKGSSLSVPQALLGAGMWPGSRRQHVAQATQPDGAGAAGAGASPDRHSSATNPITRWDQEAIEKILSGIYEDVAAELARLREHLEAQIEQLRAEVKAVQQSRLVAGPSAAGDALAATTASMMAEAGARTTDATDAQTSDEGAAPGAIMCDEPTAYRALELLYAGCSDEEAARRLGVGTSVIASVRRLLLAPAGAGSDGQASRRGQAPGLPADGNL
ncbi:hypothetical protein [Alicyclobacillus shizuokensis]|uniref:hypothetical protein n=1 Tax=Alicyclobacillus shizuokensis TaxID=392014 RepID=UPI000A70025D|nr:hypothetical protein [Alicyclobacillus shizuokensis]MCL6625608.1 hypothetical protein [Alicyclobacillus shizuokensis]